MLHEKSHTNMIERIFSYFVVVLFSTIALADNTAVIPAWFYAPDPDILAGINVHYPLEVGSIAGRPGMIGPPAKEQRQAWLDNLSAYGLSEKGGATPWLSDFQEAFSGTIEYSGTINLAQTILDKKAVIHFGQLTQDRMFRLWVNDKYVGARLWPPFELEIGNYLIAGENRIRVTVSNTLGNLLKSESVINDLKQLGWFNIYMKKLSRLGDD